MSQLRKSSRVLVPSSLVYFGSGFAALVYQVVWQRLLVIFSGADVHSATVVVGAFMAGLGCGSLAGGYVADRVSARASLALFAVAEIAVAVFGFASRALFYDVLYHRLGHLGIGLAPTAAIVFAALLWPTFFMGVSLPLLSRGVTRDVSHAAPAVGWLYGFNTLGAALGALCTTWVFLPQAGLESSLRVAAVLNLVCAIAVFPMAFAARTPAANPHVEHGSRGGRRVDAVDAPEFPGDLAPGLARWALLSAVSGFLGLSLEIVWFRLLGVMVKSTSFTFGTLLGLYLFGLGLGGALGALVSNRVQRPASGFLVLQAAAGLYAALSLMVFIASIDRAPALEWFASYFDRYDGIDINGAVSEWLGLTTAAGVAKDSFIRLYVLLPLFFVLPPTMLAGLSFPLLQRVVQRDLTHLGRRLGVVLAANVVGSTLGAFATGWFLLDALGTTGTFKFLFVLSASFGFAALGQALHDKARVWRVAAYGCAVSLVVAVVLAMPAPAVLWARLHGTAAAAIIVGEDRSGVSVLKAAANDFGRAMVFANGLGQSWIPYGGIHTVLGALPALVHPAPRTAALIGLGSGDTLYALAGRRELERITSIEIVRPQLATLRELMQRGRYPALTTVLGDPRIQHVFGDGRIQIRRSGQKYDIIQADALRPTSAYAGNLYSESYFELLRDLLTSGGLAVTWAPTPRVVRTFVKVFPYAWQHGQVLIGSNAPIRVDDPAIARRLRSPAVTDHFAWAGIDIVGLLQQYLGPGSLSFDPSHDRSGLVDINTDLYPRDEFDIPALVELRARLRSRP
jgi:spermidine synthase